MELKDITKLELVTILIERSKKLLDVNYYATKELNKKLADIYIILDEIKKRAEE